MTIETLLEKSPCLFCGYNGQGYYQAHTHAKDCPWYEVGGLEERIKQFPFVVKKLYLDSNSQRRMRGMCECLAAWSEAYPRQILYNHFQGDKMDCELIEIEKSAIKAINEYKDEMHVSLSKA
jgi:hypothetical protein